MNQGHPSINNTALKFFEVLPIYMRPDFCDQKDLCSIFRNVALQPHLLTERSTVKARTPHRPLQFKNKHLKYMFGFKFEKLLT